MSIGNFRDSSPDLTRMLTILSWVYLQTWHFKSQKLKKTILIGPELVIEQYTRDHLRS